MPAQILPTELLIDQLRESGLLDPEQVARLQAEFGGQSSAPAAVAEELVRCGWLTPFQVERVASGSIAELVLGPYVLLEPIAEGGMGRVFKARHRLMNRVVALKRIRQDYFAADAAARFQREIQALARLSHPNLVVAYDAGQVGRDLFVVMEYVPGVDLARLVRHRGPLPIAHACDYVRQAALGLQHVHECGLVHRDVKPANLLLAGTQIKVLDLGLARFSQAQPTGELTSTGLFMGTPDYVAPEQAEDVKQADVRSDVYGLGCTFHHLLTGRPPFPGGSTLDKLVKHRDIDPVPVDALRPEIDPRLAAVVQRMLAKRPDDRQQTTLEVARALAPFVEGQALEPILPVTVEFARDGHGAAAEKSTKPSGPLTTQVVRKEEPPGGDECAVALAPAMDGAPPCPPLAGTTRQGRLRWYVACAALAAFIVLLAGVILKVQSPHGCLVVRTDDPDVELTIQQGGKVVTVFDARTKERVDLPVGKYEVALTRGRKGLRMRSDRFTILRGKDAIVEVRWEAAAEPGTRPPIASAWKEGQEVDGLHGLVPNPARLPGIGRWQLETTVHRRLRRLQWSPDGRELACLGDGVIRVYAMPSGRLARLYSPRGGYVLAMAWLADGSLRAVVLKDQPLAIHHWDCSTTQLGPELQTQIPDRGFLGWSAVFGWSSDGRFVTLGSWAPEVEIFDAATGASLRVVQNLAGQTNSLVWRPGSLELAVADANGRITLIDHGQGGARSTLSQLTGTEVAWCPNGQRLAVIAGNTVRWWDAVADKVSGAAKQIPQLVTLTWRGDGKQLAAAARDGKFSLVEIDTGRVVASMGTPRTNATSYPIGTMAWNADGRTIAVGGEGCTIDVWDVDAHQRRIQIGSDRRIWTAAITPDGTKAAASSTDGVVRIIDGRTGTPGPSIRESDMVRCLAWDPTGKRVAVGIEWQHVATWNALTGVRERVLEGGNWSSLALSWSPDGRWVACGSKDATGQPGIGLWNPESGRRERFLYGKFGYVEALPWSRDGQRLAVVGDQVWLYRAKDWSAGPVLAAAKPGFRSAAFSPDGRLVATTIRGGQSLSAWEVATGHKLWTKLGGDQVAWPGNGQILDAFRGFRFLDHRTGEVLSSWPIVRRSIWSLGVDDAGRHAVAGGWDAVFSYFDLEARRVRWFAVALPGGRTAVFSPAGELLHADDGALDDLVYLVERPDGALEHLTYAEFIARLDEAGKS